MVTADAVVALAAKLDTNLQAALSTYVDAVVNGAGQAEIDAAAQAVIDAYADFHAEAEQLKVSGATDVESKLVAKVYATAEALFQNP